MSGTSPPHEQTTASLAAEAAAQALEVANLKPSELDLIIVSTSSPEHIFPATACLVQDRLGASKAGAFDLLAACTGFIYALNTGAQTDPQRLGQKCAGYRRRDPLALYQLARPQHLHPLWRWCRRVCTAGQ